MTFAQNIHFIISESSRFFTPIELAFEWAILAICFLLIFLVPRKWAGLLTGPYRLFVSVAERPLLSILLCCLLPVVLRLLMIPFSPVPLPSVHDEFSQLLLADTLAHGRLTNPTPAMWTHFQSIHIIVRPTYNSMYPPGQGAFLALGQVIFNHQPWAGVEIAIAVMCAAMYWMFSAWLTRSWSLFGMALVIIKLTLVGIWVNSYISAAVPTIGGALVVGALPRLRSAASRTLDAMLFALGVIVLMNTRPFEGAVLTVSVLVLLAPSLRSKLAARPIRNFTLMRVVVPAACLICAAAAWLGYYNYRVTGHATEMAYEVNRATYGWPENLAFLPPKEISLRDPVLNRMLEVERAHHDIYKNAYTLIDNLVTRLFDNWTFLIGPLLTIPLLLAILKIDRKKRDLVILLAVLLGINIFQLLLYPYHLAPSVPIFFCLIAAGCGIIYRKLQQLCDSRQLYFAAILPLGLLAITGVKQFSETLDLPQSSYWERGYEWHREARGDIMHWLKYQPGKHIVLVRYSPDHPVNQEWVYNGADLQNSKVIWARETDDDSDLELLKYYSDRHAWLVQADVYPQRVVPYPIPSSSGINADTCPPCALGAEKSQTAVIH